MSMTMYTIRSVTGRFGGDPFRGKNTRTFRRNSRTFRRIDRDVSVKIDGCFDENINCNLDKLYE